ncbi:MAG: hypothetical protein NVS2B12_12390 [Ktedonobacteraceae bacterium]
MQTLMRPQSPKPDVQSREILRARKKRRFSPFMFSGVIITLLIVLGAGAFVVSQQKVNTRAADAAVVDCKLIVPAQPLTAQGLATPYQLTGVGDDNENCKEANKLQAAFVQGAIFDPATSKISIYNPLVVDKGKKPAIDPVVPKLPQGAIVALWFGFNGNNLTLKGTDNSLQDGKCVDGLKKSLFGQFSYCNAPAFFDAARQAIQAGKLVPPALGTGNDGLTCPTVRNFGVVDQDQSDNVTTTYLADRKGRLAQMNAANAAQLLGADAKTQVNGSDNRLVAVALDGALGCNPWTAPDVADPGHMTTALPLNELQAAAHQAQPVALVPAGDPMVKIENDQSLRKLNLYRAGVDQPAVQDLDNASTQEYCKNLLATGPERILVDAKLTKGRPSPDPAAANNLFTFLAQRFNATFGPMGLNCQKLLNTKSPVKVENNDDNVAVSATIFGMQSIDTSNCVANGALVPNCQGKAQVDDQTCTFKLNANDNNANLNCPDNNNKNTDNGNNGGDQQNNNKQDQGQQNQDKKTTHSHKK